MRWRKKGQRRRQRERTLGQGGGSGGGTQVFLSWAHPGMLTSAEKHFSPTIQGTRNPTFVKSTYFSWEGPLRCPSFPLAFCPHSKQPETARMRQHPGAIQRVNSAQDQNRDLLLIAGVTLASYWPSLCLCLPGYAVKIKRSISLLF